MMRIVRIVLATAWAGLLAAAGSASAVPFKWANSGDAVSMDPYAINEPFTLGFLANVYDPLITLDASLKPVPALAASWKQTSPTEWEFKLRQGVKFHDGTPFTAQDVVFSHQRVISESSDLRGNFAAVAAVAAVGTDTVVVTTRHPTTLLPATVAAWPILSKTWAEKNNAVAVTDLRKKVETFASRNANGTGAFMLVSREPDVKTVLKRNPDWWGWTSGDNKAAVTEVVFTPVRQDATRVAALMSGDVDMIHSVPPQDAERIRGAGKTVLARPGATTILLGLNQAPLELPDSDIKGKNPFKNPRVREALARAINAEALTGKTLSGGAAPANSLLPPTVAGHDPALRRLAHGEAEAKKLLADAGYPEGFSFGLECPNDLFANVEKVCEAVVEMWSRIGLRPKLTAQPKALYFSKVLSRGASAYLLGWTPMARDGLDALDNLLVTPNGAGTLGRFNVGGFSNVRVDRLANQARAEIGEAKRAALLREAFSLALREVAAIPLYYPAAVWATAPNVSLAQQPDSAFLWHLVEKK